MPIVDIQRRFRELGRIRAGATEPTGKTYDSGPRKGQAKTRPVKIPRFRLTSPRGDLIDQAAAVFGGEPRAWHNDGTKADEFEVFIEADALPIVIPPGEVIDQWYEQWTGGGCSKRCDGVRQVLVDRPCSCPADPQERAEAAAKNPPQACKPTTRIRVMIPDIADVGIWRLETHGFHAAAELGGAIGLIAAASRSGALIPADLRLAHREGARRPGAPRKTFYVPSISFRGTLGPVLDSLGILAEGATMPAMLGTIEPRPALDAGGTPALPSGGDFDPTPTEKATFPGPPPAPQPPTAADTPPAPPPAPPAPTGFAPPPEPAPNAPAPPEPEAYDPPAPGHAEPAEGDGPNLTGPQVIAMRIQDRGVKDRAQRLAIVGLILGVEVESTKTLSPSEIRYVLSIVNDDGAWDEIVGELGDAPAEEVTTTTAPPVPAAPSEPIRGELVEEPRTRRRRAEPAGPPPETMNADQWREVLRERKVKVSDVIREAARLASTDGVEAPASLDAIAGSGYAALILGFVEETAAARGDS